MNIHFTIQIAQMVCVCLAGCLPFLHFITTQMCVSVLLIVGKWANRFDDEEDDNENLPVSTSVGYQRMRSRDESAIQVLLITKIEQSLSSQRIECVVSCSLSCEETCVCLCPAVVDRVER